jgi:PAS domain S-box-containing protein
LIVKQIISIENICMHTNRINNVSCLDTQRILRRQAEDIVSGQVAEATANLKALSPAVVLKLMHELQVHQLEIEMQYEELRKTQLELELMRERYFDLYDLAPISYCTTDELGVILEANLATSELLGEPRSELVGQPISRYISKECQDDYYHCRRLLYASGDRQDCELQLAKPDGEALWVYLTITAAKDNLADTVHRVVLTDITEAKILARVMLEGDAGLHTLAAGHHKSR